MVYIKHKLVHVYCATLMHANSDLRLVNELALIRMLSMSIMKLPLYLTGNALNETELTITNIKLKNSRMLLLKS